MREFCKGCPIITKKYIIIYIMQKTFLRTQRDNYKKNS